MRLVPFQPEYLRREEPLPFGLRAADGRLLLAAGHRVDNPDWLETLQSQPLFADEHESSDWYRRLAAAMDERLRQGASLGQVVSARPDPSVRDAAPVVKLSLGEQWAELVDRLDIALRDPRNTADWRSRVLMAHVSARQLAERRIDAALYHLIYESSQSTFKYSSRHALLTMLISEQTATLLGWEAGRIDSLGRAALVMNIAMSRLQDQLAADERPPTSDMRLEIDSHPERGAELLRECGWGDPLCLEVVRQHHDPGQVELPLSGLSPAQQLARLLRRVDIFAAQISLRAARAPMSPVQAARDACLGADGVPDEVGGALLRSVGLYPPGCFVELANGEISIVVARGRRANLPLVASLISSSGNVIAEPMMRDTLDRRYGVKAAVSATCVKVRPPHERLLSMRQLVV